MKLGELISKAKVKRRGEDNYPILSMTMHDGIVEQSERFKKEIASKDTTAYKVVEPGQLVVGFPIDEGVIYVQNYSYAGIMSPAYNVWNIDTHKVSPAYLELALHSPQSMNYYANKLRGTTARRRSMPPDILRQLPLFLPTKEQQDEIVATMELAKSQRETALRQLALLDTLVKSRFVEMFGPGSWPTKRLDEVADIQGGLTKNVRREKLPLQLPYLRVANVLNGGLDLSEMKTIGLSETEKEKTLLRGGDLLFVEGNGSSEQIGRCAIWNGDIDPCVHQNHLIRARFSHEAMPCYILQYFVSTAGREQIKSKAVSTSGLFTLSTGKIRSLEVPIPPLPLQQEFADFVAQVDKSRFVVQQQIDKLQTLYDSLAQEYFA